MTAKIREKNACKGVTFDKDVHAEFDVETIPFRNLELANPMRKAWIEKNPDKDWAEDKGRNDMQMRPVSKELAGHERADALSYSKLVRATAQAYYKVQVDDEKLHELMELDASEAVTDTHRVGAFILTQNGRLFQNLMAVVGVDDKNFREVMSSIERIATMFMADVVDEMPHAKPSAGGGKTKAELRAEVEAELEEKRLALLDEVKAYVRRAASTQGVAGIPLPIGATLDMLKDCYLEVLAKYRESDDPAAADAYASLETWAMPFKAMWGLPMDAVELDEAAD